MLKQPVTSELTNTNPANSQQTEVNRATLSVDFEMNSTGLKSPVMELESTQDLSKLSLEKLVKYFLYALRKPSNATTKRLPTMFGRFFIITTFRSFELDNTPTIKSSTIIKEEAVQFFKQEFKFGDGAMIDKFLNDNPNLLFNINVPKRLIDDLKKLIPTQPIEDTESEVALDKQSDLLPEVSFAKVRPSLNDVKTASLQTTYPNVSEPNPPVPAKKTALQQIEPAARLTKQIHLPQAKVSAQPTKQDTPYLQRKNQSASATKLTAEPAAVPAPKTAPQKSAIPAIARPIKQISAPEKKVMKEAKELPKQHTPQVSRKIVNSATLTKVSTEKPNTKNATVPTKSTVESVRGRSVSYSKVPPVKTTTGTLTKSMSGQLKPAVNSVTVNVERETGTEVSQRNRSISSPAKPIAITKKDEAIRDEAIRSALPLSSYRHLTFKQVKEQFSKKLPEIPKQQETFSKKK